MNNIHLLFLFFKIHGSRPPQSNKYIQVGRILGTHNLVINPLLEPCRRAGSIEFIPSNPHYTFIGWPARSPVFVCPSMSP